MLSLFDSIYRDKRVGSFGEIQFMLRLFQQDLKTVLLDISYSDEEKVVLLINSGKLICIYLINRDRTTRYPATDLVDLLQERGRATIRVCDLTPAFFCAVRTMIEQQPPSNPLPLTTANVSDYIQRWQISALPSFVHIRWPNAEGFVFIPGNNVSARQYTFLAEDKLSDSAAAVSMLSHWSEPECTVSQYTDMGNLEIWKENNLQLGFSLVLEHTLRRYDDLAGHSLSVKLEDAINRLCRSHFWNIEIAATTVGDVHIFDKYLDAASAYRSIFELVSRQTCQVIGARLFNETIDVGLAGLSEPLKQSVRNNIFTSSLVHA